MPPAANPTNLTNDVLRLLDSISVLQESDDFLNWSEDFETFFGAAGASWLVGTRQELAAATVPEEKKWLDRLIKGYLLQKVDMRWKHLVRGKTGGLEAMKAISAQFSSSHILSRVAARAALHHPVHDPEQPISMYISSIDFAVRRLANLNITVADDEILDIMVGNLHSSYGPIKLAIASMTDVTLEKARSALLNQALTSTIDIKVEPIDIAMMAKRGYTPTHPVRDISTLTDDKGFRWCNPLNEGHCHRCGRQGHPAARCVHDMPQAIKDFVMGNPRAFTTSTLGDATPIESAGAAQVGIPDSPGFEFSPGGAIPWSYAGSNTLVL